MCVLLCLLKKNLILQRFYEQQQVCDNCSGLRLHVSSHGKKLISAFQDEERIRNVLSAKENFSMLKAAQLLNVSTPAAYPQQSMRNNTHYLKCWNPWENVALNTDMLTALLPVVGLHSWQPCLCYPIWTAFNYSTSFWPALWCPLQMCNVHVRTWKKCVCLSVCMHVYVSVYACVCKCVFVWAPYAFCLALSVCLCTHTYCFIVLCEHFLSAQLKPGRLTVPACS